MLKHRLLALSLALLATLGLSLALAEGKLCNLVTSELLATNASALLGEAAAEIGFEVMPEVTVNSLVKAALER